MEWIDINIEDIPHNQGEYFIIKLYNLHADENSFDFDIVKFEQEQFVNCDGRPYYKSEMTYWMRIPDAPNS